MSTFYDILKMKAALPENASKYPFMGRLNRKDNPIDYTALTYKELLDMVDNYISDFRNKGFLETNKPVFIVVDNSINSIALIIALLELKAIPVLISSKVLDINDYDIMPYIYSKDSVDSIKDENVLKISRYVKEISDSYEKMHDKNDLSSRLVISSSGSEGYRPHLNIIKEADLINLPNQYGENGSRFYSYISCAHISGILTNLVNPLINDCTVMLTNQLNLKNYYFSDGGDDLLYEAIKKYMIKFYKFSCRDLDYIIYLLMHKKSFEFMSVDEKSVTSFELGKVPIKPTIDEKFERLNIDRRPDTLMLPRDIFDYLENEICQKLDLSSIKRIYLAGGVNSYGTIRTLRKHLPSIKEGVFVNLYGSTEANGVICSCCEEKMRTCYIDITNYENGEIRFTYDKKRIFRQKNGRIEQVDTEFNLFDFVPCLSASEDLVDDLKIDGINIKMRDKVTGEYKVNGDLGLYIDNQLYVLGRQSDLIHASGKLYNLRRIELFISNEIGDNVHCVRNPIDGTIEPYCIYNELEIEKSLEKYRRLSELIRSYKGINFKHPVMLVRWIFPISSIAGKVLKAKLHNFAKYSERQYDACIGDTQKEMRRLAEEFIAKYFSNYETTPLDEDLTFTLKAGNNFFFPLDHSIDYLFDVLDINDFDGTIKLKFKPHIIFYTDEEFEEEKEARELRQKTFLAAIRKFINTNQEYMSGINYKSFTLNEIVPVSYDIKQLIKNFLKLYEEYLKKQSYNSVDDETNADEFKEKIITFFNKFSM